MNDQEFLEALAKFAPSVRQAFIDAVQDVTDNAILAQVVEALERGDEVAAWRALGYNPSVFNRLTSAIATAFEQGAIFTMSHLPRYGTSRDGIKSMLRFNMRDREAERWLAEQSSTLITRIEDEMRGAVRDTLQEGLSLGRNPRSIALDLVGRYNRDSGHREGGTVGLGEREQLWARNVRQRLSETENWIKTTGKPASKHPYFQMKLRDARFDETVLKALQTESYLPQETIDKLVDRYRVRALQHRGETIARTETLTSLNRSEFEAIRQSQAQTGLPDEAFTKEWDSAGDRRVRHSHAEMDGQKVLFNEAFVSPVTGARMMHPGDTSLGAGGNDVIHCYAPWTKISLVGLRSMIRREYVGQLVKISVGVGDDLSVTPNHPILTERGWVGAGEIVKGDKLIYSFWRNGISAIEPDVRNISATAEQLYSSHNASGENERVSREVVNLHGEIPDHDINVVSIPSELGDRIETSGSQFFAHFTLTDTDISKGLLFFGRATEVNPRPGVAIGCRFVSSFNTLLARLTADTSRCKSVALTDIGSSEIHVSKAGVDQMSCYAETVGDSINRVSFVKHHFDRPMPLLSRFKITLSAFLTRAVRRKVEIIKTTANDDLTNADSNRDFANRQTGRVSLGNRIKMSASFVFVRLHHALAARTNNACLGNATPYEVVTHIESVCDLLNGQAFIVSDQCGNAEAFGVLPVVDVSSSHYEGPVYNFESENGLVLAENIVSHNCRCRVKYRTDFAYGE